MYVKYIKDRRRVRSEGQDPELVEFIPLVSDEEGLGDVEDTVPLDSEAATHDGDDDKATAHEASDDDDPSI